MAASFFFYDLETSGINPRDARIMQFAGQRTDMNLDAIGEPVNVLVRLSDDILPEPDAILVTGITPQQTITDGLTEAEFLALFHDEVATPGTIFVGYNSVRFDDEFMRFTHYRNFYDPYEWQYTEQKSRWDLLDVVRMTRALRPEGIEWPVDANGNPTNRLELLTKSNGINHDNAHDALNDVVAVIEIARLIRAKQPKLFDYLLTMRDKKSAQQFVTSGQPFLYSSGKYSSEFEKTTAVGVLADHPKRAGALVFDLRHDPTIFKDMSIPELIAAWRRRRDDPSVRLPVKTLQYNRCPAIAPLGVLDDAAKKRLQLDLDVVESNFKKLRSSGLASKVLEALSVLDQEQQAGFLQNENDVDSQLYDAFLAPSDKGAMSAVRAAGPKDIVTLQMKFSDKRLQSLFPLYKARNYPASLQDEERTMWEEFREHKLLGGKQNSKAARYFSRLAELAAKGDISSRDQYLLEELQLYGQSILPVEDL